MAWTIIAAQVMFPLGVAFAPAVAASVGESAEAPPKGAFFNNNVSSNAQAPIENKIAAGAMSAGHLLSAQQGDKAALNMARSAAVGTAGQSAKSWLEQFGTARLELHLNEQFRLDNSALDLLLPLYENPEALVYTQWGMRNKDHRNTANIGGGVRTFYGDWMYGLNTFYDNDFTGKNRRAGIGAEAWTHYLKLSANSYFRLSGWHASRDFEDYNERPANGYDLRAEAFLPSHPQLGGKLMYESYRGGEVALFGKNNRQKDPYAFTLGLNYTPFPLLTLGGEHRQGKSGQQDSRINLQINYRLGDAWLSQMDPSAVAAGRALSRSRYDLVERNNHIVLDYKKQDVIRLLTPERLSGKSGQRLTITAQVAATHALERIEWDSAALVAAGGAVAQPAPTLLSITLPPYLAAGAANRYTIGATAYDKKGNASNRAYTSLTVSGHGVSVESTLTEATPDTLASDGVATSRLTVHLRDEYHQPLTGLADALTLTLAFDGGDAQPSPGTQPQPLLGNISESAAGVYIALLTAGKQAGRAVITPAIHGQTLKKISINLLSPDLDPAQSRLDISSDTILAGGVEHASVAFSAKDIAGNAVIGLGSRLSFDMTPLTGAVLTAIVEDNGRYGSTLSGTQPGEVTVTPVLDTVKLTHLAKTLRLRAAQAYEGRSGFNVIDDSLVVGSQSTTLIFTARDMDGNLIKGLGERLEFTAAPPTGISLSAIAENNGEYTARFSGVVAGRIDVTPAVDGVRLSGLSKAITLMPGPISEPHSSFSLSGDTLVANGRDSVILELILRDEHGNNAAEGETVDFHTSAPDVFTQSALQFNNGVHSARLSGSVPGAYSVTPSFKTTRMASLEKTLTLLPVEIDITQSTFAISQDTLVADNIETATLTFNAKDTSGRAVTGLGARLVFSVSPGDDVTLSPLSESDGTYTATVRGTRPGIVRVAPKVDGVEISEMVNELNFTPGSIELKVRVDKEEAKAGEQIMLTVEATLEDGSPAEDVIIDIHSLGAVNRQNMSESATLSINDAPKYEGGVVTATGKISIPLTDPLGKGVKTTIEVTARKGKSTTQDVIFTVATSPNVPAANYYGHMAESIDGVSRPKLAVEFTGSGSERFNNENWALASFQEASLHCTLPPFASVDAAYSLMPAGGWPLLPGGSNGFIWSSTILPPLLFGNRSFVIALNTLTGGMLIFSEAGIDRGLVVCVD